MDEQVSLKKIVAGAKRSWTVWFNTLLVGIAMLEAGGAHLTALFGANAAAKIVAIGGIVNIILRVKTTQSLAERGKKE